MNGTNEFHRAEAIEWNIRIIMLLLWAREHGYQDEETLMRIIQSLWTSSILMWGQHWECFGFSLPSQQKVAATFTWCEMNASLLMNIDNPFNALSTLTLFFTLIWFYVNIEERPSAAARVLMTADVSCSRRLERMWVSHVSYIHWTCKRG